MYVIVRERRKEKNCTYFGNFVNIRAFERVFPSCSYSDSIEKKKSCVFTHKFRYRILQNPVENISYVIPEISHATQRLQLSRNNKNLKRMWIIAHTNKEEKNCPEKSTKLNTIFMSV